MLSVELSVTLPKILGSGNIQLAKGLPNSTIGFNNSSMLAKDSVYDKPLVELLENEKYVQVV